MDLSKEIICLETFFADKSGRAKNAWGSICKFLEESCQLPTTQVKSSADATAEQICPSCGGPVWVITQAPSFQCKDVRCQRAGKLLLT